MSEDSSKPKKLIVFEGFDGVKPARLRKIGSLGWIRAGVLLMLVRPSALVGFINFIRGRQGSYSAAVVAKVIVDYLYYKTLDIAADEIDGWTGDSIGTVTASLVFKEIPLLDGLRFVYRSARTVDKLSADLDRYAVIFSSRNAGVALADSAFYQKLLTTPGVLLSSELSPNTFVFTAPAKTAKTIVNELPHDYWAKIISTDSVAHYPKHAGSLPDAYVGLLQKLTSKAVLSGCHYSNRLTEAGSVIASADQLRQEFMGVICDPVSIKQTILNHSELKPVFVGCSGYLEGIYQKDY